MERNRSHVKRAKGNSAKRSGGKRVLIVDDNPAIRHVVSQAFRSDGFAVCGEADDGRQAITLAKQVIPDLIILDLSMPVMNGLQAAPELRRIAPKASIILLTMFANQLPLTKRRKLESIWCFRRQRRFLPSSTKLVP
jgi:CheY-like chemotaxis protein